MMFRKIWKSASHQAGFTLIELLVGVAISGLLTVGVMTAISQTINVNASSTSRMIAIKQIEHAIDTIRPDVIMAQKVTPSGSSSGFPLTLDWIEWTNNKTHKVEYSLSEEKLIQEEWINGEKLSERTVAEHIESISMLNPDIYSGGRITLTITANVGGYKPASESRTVDILPRPAQ